MPYKEKEIKKKYFLIGEVAEILGVNTSAIRFLDDEFMIMGDRKLGKRRRMTQKHIDIFRALSDDRLTMKGKKELLKKKELVFKI